MGMYPRGFFRDSSKTSSTSESVCAVNFSSQFNTLPTKNALLIAPAMNMSIETMISVMPMPKKPSSQTFVKISMNPSIINLSCMKTWLRLIHRSSQPIEVGLSHERMNIAS